MAFLPETFRTEYAREVARALAAARPAPEILSEAHLAGLPAAVSRYLHATGFVGRPLVQSFATRFRGRIRSAKEARWMSFRAEQVSCIEPATRLFLMHARHLGMPIKALHRMVRGHASMRVRALGAISVVDAHGPVMDRSEAVTYLNDLCILAPGALVHRDITWEGIDDRCARARFASGVATVSAVLYFDGEGLLRNFVSEDRSRSAPDGKSFAQLRFSTPVANYRDFGPYRIAAHGDARWHLPSGPFTYAEFEILDVTYNMHAEAIEEVA